MKAELLSSVDTLTSHLVTTFSALSTALAKSSSSESASISRVYIAILVGPSLGTAKSKVIYGVDSFAIRVWGTRDDEHHADEDEGDDSGEERPEDSEDDESDEGACSEGTGTEDDVSDDDVESIEGARGVQEGKVEEQPEEESTEEENDQAGKKKENTMQYHHHQLSPSPHQSYAEEQRFLQAADRMLARALASADAEGRGISNEMSPSQIYILIRAPRRFVHSAWVPRQNLTNQMEATWSDFIDESWRVNDGLSPKKKKPVEGVWVTARGGLRGPKASSESVAVQEDDEMIWWSWDGKLVGFSDW